VSVTEIYVFCPSEVNVRSHIGAVLSWEVNARSHVSVVLSWEVNVRSHVSVVLSWEVNVRSHVCVVLSCGVNVRNYVFVFVILSFLLLSLSMVISTVIFVEVFFCLEIWKVKEEIIHLRLVINYYVIQKLAPPHTSTIPTKLLFCCLNPTLLR